MRQAHCASRLIFALRARSFIFFLYYPARWDYVMLVPFTGLVPRPVHSTRIYLESSLFLRRLRNIRFPSRLSLCHSLINCRPVDVLVSSFLRDSPIRPTIYSLVPSLRSLLPLRSAILLRYFASSIAQSLLPHSISVAHSVRSLPFFAFSPHLFRHQQVDDQGAAFLPFNGNAQFAFAEFTSSFTLTFQLKI